MSTVTLAMLLFECFALLLLCITGNAEVQVIADDICETCVCIKRASTVDCEKKKLTFVPKFPSPCCGIRLKPKQDDMKFSNVDFSNNEITSVPARAFSAVSDTVYSIELDRNRIMYVSPQAFAGCAMLIKLDLSHNEIGDLHNDVFRDVRTLDSLKLNNNRLKTLRRGQFDGLRLVRKVFLNDNFIQSIEDGVFDQMKSVAELNLASNKLHTLQAGLLSKLISLEMLNLSDNYLVTIEPRAFVGTEQLKTMDLDANCLESFPADELEHMPQVNVITLKNNPISCSTVPRASPVAISRCYKTDTPASRNETRALFDPKCSEARLMQATSAAPVTLATLSALVASSILTVVFANLLHS